MIRALALALVAAAALAGPASAGTVTVADGVVTYTADPDSNAAESVTVTVESGVLRVVSELGAESAECNAVDANTVECPLPTRVEGVFLEFHDQWHGGGLPIPQVVHGGDGSDRFEDGTAADVFHGDAGDDTFAATAPDAGDRFHGGDGTQDLFTYLAYAVPVTTSADGIANDGADGEADDPRSDVEWFEGSPLGDRLSGGPGRQVLLGGSGDDLLDAADGDTLDAVDCGDGAADHAILDPGIEAPPMNCDSYSFPDTDADGSPDHLDCDDADAAVRPGATEVPDNGVDEDCSGADSATPVLAASVSAKTRRGRRFTRLRVTAPAGATVAVRCRGKRKRCPKGTRTFTVGASGRTSVLGALRKRRLRRGARVVVTVTAPGTRGKRFTFRVRPPRSPKRTITQL